MTRSEPPRLAVALLRRFLPRDEPLIGDLVERFAVRQSRLWFWRETIVALVVRAFQQPDHERPLGLEGYSAIVASERSRNVDRPYRVNLTASPLPGVGGLGLVALGVLVALFRPDVWWIFVPALVGGALLGLTMVFRRRHVVLSGDAKTSQTLFARNSDGGGRRE